MNAGINAQKTNCLRGHAFSPENTRLRTDGSRDCKTCSLERKRIGGSNAEKTHCVRGHEFTPENTYFRRDGATRGCKLCLQIYKISARAKRYGQTAFQLQEMEEKQNHLCAICGQPEKHFGCLSMDHDHETGENRELLCSRCNPALGLFNDDPELLLRAAEYLVRHKENTQCAPLNGL